MANQPVHRIKVGSIEVAIWENILDGGGKSYSFGPPTKSYKDKNDKWQTTNNLRSGEAFAAIVAYQKAFEFIYFKDKDVEQVSRKEAEVEEP